MYIYGMPVEGICPNALSNGVSWGGLYLHPWYLGDDFNEEWLNFTSFLHNYRILII